MKNLILFVVLICLSCGQDSGYQKLNPLPKMERVDYDQINEQAQEILRQNDGKFPMIKMEWGKGDKQLLYFGEQHGNDPNDPRFDLIEAHFYRFKPQILLNEGGQVADSIHYKSREEAISKNGSIGFLKYLADQAGIPLHNADCTEEIEIRELMKQFKKKDVLYFLIMQRFVTPFVAMQKQVGELDHEYQKFISSYLINRCQIRLSENEGKWHYFEKLYAENNNGIKINLNQFDLSMTEFSEGKMKQISHQSLWIRDQFIIQKIHQELQENNRVMTVFGALHLLAEKQTLNKIFNP